MTFDIGEFFQTLAMNANLQESMVIALTWIVLFLGWQKMVLRLQFLLQR